MVGRIRPHKVRHAVSGFRTLKLHSDGCKFRPSFLSVLFNNSSPEDPKCYFYQIQIDNPIPKNEHKATMLRSLIPLFFAAGALAQTPAGSSAHTTHNLGAAYQNATITPGVWISPDGMHAIPVIFCFWRS